jgi:hypothetical protein
VNLNYTYVDSKISLSPEQRTVQTSLERALAGQSKHLFNAMVEVNAFGFSARALYNYFGDRISDVGSNEAPDIVEEGRGALDLVISKSIRKANVRLTFENLTDEEFRFTQGRETQRLFKPGRVASLSVSFDVF